jgi:hypothetical protein
MDSRIAAIREDKRVGKNSCSSIDECMTDQEIQSALDEAGILTPDAALKWALRSEGLHLEQGLNCRFGEDDDSQLLAYREFQKINNGD